MNLFIEAWHVIVMIGTTVATGLTIFVLIHQIWIKPSQKRHKNIAAWRKKVDDFIKETSSLT